jgi:murein DD-endopeptidase MepM/ murein hydrolase activator NlpD
VGVATIVLGAALISAPGAPDATGAAGSLTGRSSQPRLAVAGGDLYRGGPSGAGHDLGWDGSVGVPPGLTARIVDGPQGSGAGAGAPAITGSSRLPQDELAGEHPATPKGAYLADGTLLKPIAVDTSIPDSSGLLKTYKVRSGDTLTGIANRFGVSMMTIWWANNLQAKDALVVGQKLLIPPTNGLVVTVKEGDTLASIATRTGAAEADIVEYNDLEGDRVVIGQTLVVPGARGAPIATPKPTPAPRAASSGSGGSGSSRRQATSAQPPTRYNGGSFRWPVAGGYLSQRYHYGHYGIDIAADRGTPVLAAGGGVVTFAGWRSNGGGYQVWISHGSNLYTTYNHMSSVSVHAGQRVSKGQRVGRVGATGWATGPHLHFEVWRGSVWSGGHRVNPYGYL